MKRHPALHPLSRDHHHFLMWCRNMRWYVTESPRAPDLDTLLAEIRELKPLIVAHFTVEETKLFPLSERIAGAAVQPYLTRLGADHEYWRTHFPDALAGAEDEIQPLAALAQHLHDHIRYEERVWFPFLQAHLTESEWDELAG